MPFHDSGQGAASALNSAAEISGAAIVNSAPGASPCCAEAALTIVWGRMSGNGGLTASVTVTVADRWPGPAIRRLPVYVPDSRLVGSQATARSAGTVPDWIPALSQGES